MGESLVASFNIIKHAIRSDPGYALSWHCNIAMAMQDEGVDYETANKAASRFMQMCFGVDTMPTDDDKHKL